MAKRRHLPDEVRLTIRREEIVPLLALLDAAGTTNQDLAEVYERWRAVIIGEYSADWVHDQLRNYRLTRMNEET